MPLPSALLHSAHWIQPSSPLCQVPPSTPRSLAPSPPVLDRLTARSTGWLVTFRWASFQKVLTLCRYADGKVCLSLLGTWHGGSDSEKWQPGKSSLFQVLLSLQGMIFIAGERACTALGGWWQWGERWAVGHPARSEAWSSSRVRWGLLGWDGVGWGGMGWAGSLLEVGKAVEGAGSVPLLGGGPPPADACTCAYHRIPVPPRTHRSPCTLNKPLPVSSTQAHGRILSFFHPPAPTDPPPRTCRPLLQRALLRPHAGHRGGCLVQPAVQLGWVGREWGG